MLESNFSKQVVVPFLNQSFPIERQKREDRLLRSIIFPSDTQTALRLHAINHNYKVVSTIERRTINLHIPEDEWNAETDKLRIKAYLSIPVDGVRESHWVTQHHVDYGMAQSHNQYRVRGVSIQGYLSDWVYSEIRDDENDLILYELLYEIIDVLQTINDKDIAYLLDYALEDVFNIVFYSGKPVPITSLALNDETKTKINELLQVFSTIFTSSFKEDVFASAKEFAEIAQTYKLLEKYQETKLDFLVLLIERYLEEKYDELIKKVDIEVFLKNDEEMQVLLQSMYEFDIKNELIRSLYDIEPHDRFVTSLNDAVELISEPIVFEQLKTTPKETIEQFMRLAFQELYVPLLIMDQRVAELTHELSDNAAFKSQGDIIEVDTINDEELYKLLLAYDVLESLAKDLVDPEMDFHLQFIEKIIQTANQKQLSLFIEYSPIEFIELMVNIKENFQTKYSLLNNAWSYKVNIKIDDYSEIHSLKEKRTLKEAYMAKVEEFNDIKHTIASRSYQERVIVDILEKILNNEMMNKMDHQYNMSLIVKEKSHLDSQDEVLVEQAKISLITEEMHQIYDQTVHSENHDFVSLNSEEHIEYDQQKAVTQNLDHISLKSEEMYYIKDQQKVFSENQYHVSLNSKESYSIQNKKKDVAKNQDILSVNSQEAYFIQDKQQDISESQDHISLSSKEVYFVEDKQEVINENQDDISFVAKEKAFIQEDHESFRHQLIQKILMNEYVISQLDKWFVSLRETLKGYPIESYSNVWSPNLQSNYNELLLEKKDIEINQELTDEFVMSGKEVVRYILGEIGGDWPLGQFILGINTLKGQTGGIQTG